jgi:ribosome maturation factor RimP
LIQIRDWVLEKTGDPEFSAYFLVDLEISPARKVEIFLDGDQGLDLGVCRQFSRYLEEKLDATGLLGDDYTLEVSSPGATRPLKLPRQYPKHIGRTLQLELTDESQLEGILREVLDEGILLEVSTGKGKKKIIEPRFCRFDALIKATVKLAFK